MSSLPSFFLSFLLLCHFCLYASSEPTQDKQSLLSATPHSSRVRWDSSLSACSWVGVVCDSTDSSASSSDTPGSDSSAPSPLTPLAASPASASSPSALTASPPPSLPTSPTSPTSAPSTSRTTTSPVASPTPLSPSPASPASTFPPILSPAPSPSASLISLSSRAFTSRTTTSPGHSPASTRTGPSPRSTSLIMPSMVLSRAPCPNSRIRPSPGTSPSVADPCLPVPLSSPRRPHPLRSLHLQQQCPSPRRNYQLPLS